MSPILLAGFAGIGAGGVMLFFSHIAPRFGAGKFVRDLDEMRLFGRTYSRRESHVVGVLIHLFLSFFFGAVYAFGVDQGLVADYGFWPLATYAVLVTVFTGGVIMPLEGHGVFGVREDDWFPIDLLIANILWVFLYSVIVRLWLAV